MKCAGITLALAFFAAGSVLGAASAPAFAADNGDMIVRLMGKAPGSKTYACFSRVYDAAHLAAHPVQKATSMKVLVKMENDKETKQPTFNFVMGVTNRGSKTVMTTAGDCGQVRDGKDEGPVTRLGCGVECDGGGLGIAMGEGNRSIRVSIERIRVSPKGVSAEEGGEDFGGGDDDMFRLDRTSVADCATLLEDRKEASAVRRLK